MGEPGKTASFYVHADILSRSKVLKAEVEGPWKETSERRIYWSHWTINAAERFMEWLYTGDYKCPHPVPIDMVANEDDRTDSAHFSNNMATTPGPEVREAVKQVTSTVQRRQIPIALRLQDLTWEGCHPLRMISQAEEYDMWAIRHASHPCKVEYASTVETHISLYLMACHYMLDELKNMAWQRLRPTFVSIKNNSLQGHAAGLSHLPRMTCQVYTETGMPDGAEEEPMRMLLSTFTARHISSYTGSPLHKLMESELEADREFRIDLMHKLQNQVRCWRRNAIVASHTTSGSSDESGEQKQHTIPVCSACDKNRGIKRKRAGM